MIFVTHSSGGVTTRILMLDARLGAINRYVSILRDEDQYYLECLLSNTSQCRKVHAREGACPRKCMPKKKGRSSDACSNLSQPSSNGL